MAMIVSAIINTTRAVWGKKGTPMTEAKDFMIDWGSEEEPKGQSVEEMKQTIYDIERFFNNPRRIKRMKFLEDSKHKPPKTKTRKK